MMNFIEKDAIVWKMMQFYRKELYLLEIIVLFKQTSFTVNSYT